MIFVHDKWYNPTVTIRLQFDIKPLKMIDSVPFSCYNDDEEVMEKSYGTLSALYICKAYATA